jgi:hypothetical protein
MKIRTIIPLLVLIAPLHAGTRASTGYTIPADTVDSGGGRVTSAIYTNDGSAGLVAGISMAPDQTVVKSGYVAQLTDATGITLSAPQLTVAESATIQIQVAEVLDDDTTSPVPAESVAWGVQSGPLASVSTSGLATAAFVYQNTQATVAASHLGFHATFVLTVVNTGSDDPGGYVPSAVADTVERSAQGVTKIAVARLLANDSDPLGRTLTISSVSSVSGGSVTLSGRWITFTPDAGLADGTAATFSYVLANGTGSTAIATVTLNAPGTSYTTSPATLLAGGIVNNPGGPGKVLTFAAIPNFVYQVEASSDLGDPAGWAPLGSFTAGADGRLVITDTGAVTPSRFYRFRK